MAWHLGPMGTGWPFSLRITKSSALWDVERRQRLSTISLRSDAAALGALAMRQTLEPGTVDPGVDRLEPGPGPLPAAALSSSRNGSGATPSPPRPPSFGRRLAPAGQYLAVLMPDNKGVQLIDVASGTPLRALHRPDRSQIISVLADAAGQRLVTIESVAVTDDLAAAMEANGELADMRGEFQINLWEPDHLDQPTALRFRLPGSGRSTTTAPGRSVWPPLVAISPDGKTVVVAPARGGQVRLFSGSTEDGNELPGRRQIDTQTDLSALALGQNGLLATAGGGMVRLWDVDSRTFLTELAPTQSFTWQMRFSPRGTLLALAGPGSVELWDPVAHALRRRVENPRTGQRPGFHSRRPKPGRRGSLGWHLPVDGEGLGDSDPTERTGLAPVVLGF